MFEAVADGDETVSVVEPLSVSLSAGDGDGVTEGAFRREWERDIDRL